MISRDEFHRRYMGFALGGFKSVRQKTRLMSVAVLMREAIADAPYRNHKYLFNGTELDKLPLQETTVGIKNSHPEITTEAERLAHVVEEVYADRYAPVPISRSIEYPSIFYIEDGFHRIVAANLLGLKRIRCLVRTGHFRLNKSVNFVELEAILSRVDRRFPKYSNNSKTLKLLRKAIKLKREQMAQMSLVYSVD